MDKETAHRLADELIKNEKSSSPNQPRLDTAPQNDVGIGHFLLPVILTATATWIALISGASGLLALAIGCGVGIAVSHLILKHIL